MLEKQIVIDKIEILEDGTIQTREKTRILEDGVVISEKNTNRSIIPPGEDTGKMDQRVRDIAAVVHTPEKIQAYELKKAAREAELAETPAMKTEK
jgi:hypothetical protein